MKMYVFEGTAEEISKVVHTMQPTASSEPPEEASPSTMQSKTAEGPTKFVTTEFARRALTRIPLSDAFKAVIEALDKTHPEYVLTADLYEATNYTSAQFAGLMGAFGRRMLYTEGYDENADFFDSRRNEEAGEWEWRLPDTVREALRLENLV